MTATGKAPRHTHPHCTAGAGPAAHQRGILIGMALAAGLAWLLTLSPCTRAATQLTIATEDYAPYHMPGKNGGVTGFVTDKVREMLSRAHVRGSIVVLPWKRAYHTALRYPDHCVFSTTRTAEREKLFKWVGPIAHSEWTLYTLAERRVTVARLEDARGYTIGTYNGDARDEFLRSKGFQVDAALDDQQNLPKLLSGRIGLWATDKYTANRLIRQHNRDKHIVQAGSFNRVDLFLACHPTTPDPVLNGLRRALASMIKDGTTARLEQRYERWPG